LGAGADPRTLLLAGTDIIGRGQFLDRLQICRRSESDPWVYFRNYRWLDDRFRRRENMQICISQQAVEEIGLAKVVSTGSAIEIAIWTVS
jgi:hypothetical protein